MKNNIIILLFKKLAFWAYFLVFTLIFLTSCEKNKKINNNELNIILEKNKSNNLFMSFYAHMPLQVKDALIERELNNGTLKKINENGISFIIYPLNYDNYKVADFYFFNFPTYVELWSKDGGVEYYLGNHDLKLERILNIYKNKYKPIYSNRYLKYGATNDSIVLTNNSNVVIVTAYFSQSYNYRISRLESLSSIELKHYTNETFKEMINELRHNSLNLEIIEKNRLEEINKQNKKTLQDLN